MKYIVLIAVIGILLLQWTDSIPLASVGGSMTIGLTYIVAALAVGIHEAWTKKRGVLGWIVNIVVTFIGALVAAPIGGMLIGILLSDVAVAGGLGRSAVLCRARRRDAGHAAGSVGRAVDREPMAMSMSGREPARSTSCPTSRRKARVNSRSESTKGSRP
jgi:hypothetical protein